MSKRGRDYAEARDHRPQASQCKLHFIPVGCYQEGNETEDNMPEREWNLFIPLQKLTPAGKQNAPKAAPGRFSPETSVWTVEARGPLTICSPSVQQAFHWSRPSLLSCPPPFLCLHPLPPPYRMCLSPEDKDTKIQRSWLSGPHPSYYHCIPFPLTLFLLKDTGTHKTSIKDSCVCFSCLATFQYRSLSHEHSSWWEQAMCLPTTWTEMFKVVWSLTAKNWTPL